MDNVAMRLLVGSGAVLLSVFLAALVLSANLDGGDLGLVVNAQERQAVVYSVVPGHPDCINLSSATAGERTLVITGEDLNGVPNAMLQFRRIYARESTALIGQQAAWESSERITLDMGLIEEQLNNYPLMFFWVRIADAEGRGLSNWSDRVNVAKDAKACTVSKPAPIPTPFPGSFPPTAPVRGVSGDLWADVIIGERDYSQIGENRVVPFKVFNPGGVVVDRSAESETAYVWDSANNRILGIDLAKCYEGDGPCSADIVIGQPSGYDYSACNGDSSLQNYPYRAVASAETLCGIRDIALSPGETHTFVTMAVDKQGSLYVPDSVNNRILKYNSPMVEDAVADRVWGQRDFSGMACNRGAREIPSAFTLCFHAPTNQGLTNWYGNGVEIDAQGNMWVADGGNNRVLRFPADPQSGDIAGTADVVLGQPNFRSAAPRGSLDGLHGPSAVRFGEDGGLYVADTLNDRVLIFKPPFVSGMRANMEFGSNFYNPTSLEIDPLGRGVWVVDAGNRMIELWDHEGASVRHVLGEDSNGPARGCGARLSQLPENPSMCGVAGSVGIDGTGHVLVPVYLNTADVIRFLPPALRTGGELAGEADKRFFYPPTQANFKDKGSVQSARGIAVWQNQLVVADIGRLLFWNGLEDLFNGRPADGVVGDEFNEEQWEHCCGKIKVDAAGRLWVLGFEGRHFFEVYQLPLTEGSVPLHTTWREDASFPVLGTKQRVTLGHRIFGIAPEGVGEFLWLSDTDNHRVIRIRDPLRDPVVDVILGQWDASGTLCNQGRFAADDRTEIGSGNHLDVLCSPGALSFDREGNLYVSDHALEVEGNKRLLVFSPFSGRSAISQAIFAPHAKSVNTRSAPTPSRLSIGSLWDRRIIGTSWFPFKAATWEPAFDSMNRMVVGYNAYLAPDFQVSTTIP